MRRAPRSAALLAAVLTAGAGAVAAPAAAAAPAIVTIGLDDGWASAWNARAPLLANGLHAVFYLDSGFLDRAGRLTTAQALQLAADGDEIGGHTIDHANLQALPAAAAQVEVCDDRLALAARGLVASTFAYPYGLLSAEDERVVAACGYASARRVGPDDLTSGAAAAGRPLLESSTPADRYATRSFPVSQATPLAAIERGVASAEAAAARGEPGTWLQLVLHQVCDVAAGGTCLPDGTPSAADPAHDYRITTADLASLAAFLAGEEAAGRVVVRTPSQVLGGSAAPALAAPVPPLALPDGDAETPPLDGGRATPCFRAEVAAGAAATLARVPRGTGHAYLLTQTAPGIATLASDRGDCPVQLPAGHRRVVVSAIVAGTAPTVRIGVLARDAQRTWRRIASRAVALGPGERLATLPVTTLPADSTALAVSLELNAPGTLLADDVAVSDGDAGSHPLAVAIDAPAVGFGLPAAVRASATSTGDAVDHVTLYASGAPRASALGGTLAATTSAAPGDPALIDLVAEAQDGSGTIATARATVYRASSMERTGADGVADCVQRGGYGTYAADGGGPGYAYAHVVEAGNAFERVVATGWRSGARSIVSSQRRLACAPAAQAGQRVRVAARVRGTGPTQLVLYAHTPAGWTYLARSGVALGPSLAQAGFTSPPLPAGTDAVSGGVQLTGNGRLDVDELVVVPSSP